MACTCGKCQECDWARSHPSEDAALRQTDSAEQTTADRRKLMRDRHIILKRERDLDVMDHAAMEQNLTPTEISNPFKTGTRVFWFTNERSKRVFHAGTVTGYEYVDMPWKLYVIAEDKTGRTALLHPERLGGKLDVVPAMEGDCTQHVEDAAASALESTVRPANSWRLTSNAYI